jgi:ATP-dependent Clp protease ATP-binding subunit ClpB
VFLLVGATGSGKTELAKSLAKHAFENRLIRFDMNEFTEGHSTQRLVGAPPGYVGSDDGGQLTRVVTRMRSGVLLLDEIEKAHSDVYKLIMGLLDEGRITEQSTGLTADASAFVIIMTSNAEHAKLAALMQKVGDPDERRRAVKDTLLGVFKPEQLARVDDIFCFAPLDRRAIAQVIGKFLYSFADEAGVKLAKVDADLLIQTILRHEKQESYGIRELVRLIEKAVIDGMLAARDAGAQAVEIHVADHDRIEILPVRPGFVAK